MLTYAKNVGRVCSQPDASSVSPANPVLSTAVNPAINVVVNPGLTSGMNTGASHPFFDDSKFILVKNVEIKEIDGSWRSAQIYARKEDPSIVTLFFGSTEYEGLDGDYKMGPDGKIYDGDGDMIQYRNAVNQFDAARALSSSAAAANATARVQQQQHQHYQQLHPQHQQAQPQQIPQQPQAQQQQPQQQPQHQNAAAIGMPVPVTIAPQRGVPMMLNATADKNTEKWHLLELQDALDGVMESRFCVGGEWQLEQPIVVTCHQPKGASTDAATPKVVQTLQFPMSAQDVKQLEMHPFIRSLHAPRQALESQFKQSLPSNCFDVNIDLAVSSSAPASSSAASSSGPYRHFSSSILQRIHTSLVPEAHLLRAELQHMSWRNPGFKQTTFAHQTRDSLKGQLANPHNTFVGVLELVLPAPFQGGALRIRHQQREKQFLYPAFDPSQATATGASHFIPRNCIAWTAFFGEACFCVSPIVEDETQHNGGSRVSLIYFLFRESHPPPDPYVDHLLLRVHMLQEQLRQALQSPNFFPAGGRLHLRMRHLYDERHIAVTEEKMLVCFRESSGPVSIQGSCNISTDILPP